MASKKLEEIIAQFSEDQKRDYEQMHPLARAEYERRLLIKGCPPVDNARLSFLKTNNN